MTPGAPPPGGRVVRAVRAATALLRWVESRVHDLRAAVGLVLTAGLALAVAALAAFASLTDEVLEGEMDRLDGAVLRWLEGWAGPGLDRFALEVTAVGDLGVMVVMVVVGAALLWAAGEAAWAVLLAVSASGAGILIDLLKGFFGRSRPQVVEWRSHDPITSAAYPSGHATIAMVVFLVLAYVVHRLAGSRAASVTAALVGVLLIALVGLSRIYLGVHYPSDVLAGYAVGFAWAVFCALAVEAWREAGAG